jgi:hypothetical protein
MPVPAGVVAYPHMVTGTAFVKMKSKDSRSAYLNGMKDPEMLLCRLVLLNE